MNENMWGYRESSGRLEGIDLTGFKVEAADGAVGKVDAHSDDVDSAYLVVDTGPWIFGKEVLLPAGTVTRIDVDEQRIYVDRTRDQIKAAPEFDREKHLEDADYHRLLGGYYGGPAHRA
ncbi:MULTISPECIES: PRC-barrel domain-containing protein [unclassified Streptomyces]|uniref:PRC-barrel domain-containing protein n=1 Tax=unclassified Streptomyces TaxID=2593676 RepID=UPI001BE64401|nr:MULTISPECIES: PRC-barrel domain-containing protein [unclassified Streptomyces]MBT2408072.1 PRC-barrel domain containing protein [Streptomyces sp. ISL-21]MBT2455773.1 PRC-barrel domain containing protein [Streptomyces sp. ISL-86]MBT2609522.1 PRC-barrel domain containing protein [Streptomyces sp. ISL-87]